MTEVQFGWLVRSIHSWSANLLIATLFIHMFSVFFLKAYRPPRELTWVSGVLLLFIMLGFGFSGYLLPWNQLAFFATKVGTDIAGVLPFVGKFLLRFLRGGDDVTGATGIHVAVLPAIATALIAVHVLLVQKHGMSVPLSLEGQNLKTMKFFPNFLLRDLIGWILAIGALAALAAIFPWELGEKADPFASAPAGIRPEWYFLFMFQTLKLIPSKILIFDGEVVGILAFALAGLFWLVIPFLDKPSLQGKKSNVFTAIGLIVVLYIIAMTIYGYLG
jgi:cytochrome b6